MAQDRLGLYTTCAIPSILYYLLVHRRPTRPSAPIFYSVVLLELIVPVLHNGQGGKNFDRAVVGIVGCFSAITMLLAGGRGSSSPSLTNVGVLWQKSAEKKKNDGSRTIDTVPVAEIRKDGFRWFIQGIILVLLSFPTMAIFDGFLRVCNEPPKNDTSYSLASYYYYFSLFGIAMVMHVAILPAYQLLFTSLRLLIRSLRINDIDKDKIQLLSRSYISLRDQPPMFDRPWLARSVHELWSKRWHQMLRQAFKTFAFTPVKNLFKNDTVGRAAGTMAVFAYSGLIHEYIIVVIIGYTEYIHRPGVFARQTAFFLLQGVATIISGQRDCHLPAWLGRILTLTFMIITAPLFLEPFLRIGLHIDAEIPGYPKFLDPHIGIICPFGAKNI